MKLLELIKVLELLKSRSPEELSVFAIAKETGVASENLRNFLPRHKDYFVKAADKQAFRINRFGKFKGSVDAIIQDYETQVTPKTTDNMWLFYLLFTAVFVSLSAAY